MKYQRKTANALARAALASLKREFRRWYGMISIDELASNRELAIEISVLEQILARQGV
jgi:hypothetical protein